MIEDELRTVRVPKILEFMTSIHPSITSLFILVKKGSESDDTWVILRNRAGGVEEVAYFYVSFRKTNKYQD